MVYHPKSLRCLSVLQIIVGIISLLLGIESAVLLTDLTSFIGFGIWVGVWIIVAGILGFFGSRNPQVPNKCLLGTFMGFTITACVMAGTMLIFYSFALSHLVGKLSCYNRDVERSRYDSHRYYSRYYYCNERKISTIRAGIGIDSVLLIISILEFAVGLASSIYCCAAACLCCNGTSAVQGTQGTPQVVYLQPAMGQVSAAGGRMVLVSGGPPGTVVQPSAAQFVVQQSGQPYKSQDAPPAYSWAE